MKSENFKVIFYIKKSTIIRAYVYYSGILIGLFCNTPQFSYNNLVRQLIARLLNKPLGDICIYKFLDDPRINIRHQDFVSDTMRKEEMSIV